MEGGAAGDCGGDGMMGGSASWVGFWAFEGGLQSGGCINEGVGRQFVLCTLACLRSPWWLIVEATKTLSKGG